MKCSPDNGHQPVHVKGQWYRCPECGQWFRDCGTGLFKVARGPQ